MSLSVPIPFRSDVASLRGEGVRAVVNTCEEYAGPLNEYHQHGIEQLHIPTTDFTHPRLSDIEAAVEFIQKYKLQNDTVYVHCKAGRARSATVALCWLVKYGGMSIDQAQSHLLRSRPHVNPRIAKRPVVGQFVAAVRAGETDSGVFPEIEEPLTHVAGFLIDHESSILRRRASA